MRILKKPIFLPDKMVEVGSRVNGWQQRAVTGAVSLLCQPTSDLLNPFPDKETKKYSVMKTIVKVIVGTCVGVSVRMYTQKLAGKLFNKGLINIPQNITDNIEPQKFIDNAAMLFGVIGCFFTNFMFDMPLTKKGMNWCMKKFKLNEGGDNQKT